jgi:hypothetical protein
LASTDLACSPIDQLQFDPAVPVELVDVGSERQIELALMGIDLLGPLGLRKRDGSEDLIMLLEPDANVPIPLPEEFGGLMQLDIACDEHRSWISCSEGCHAFDHRDGL